jgi:hypothetical protein
MRSKRMPIHHLRYACSIVNRKAIVHESGRSDESTLPPGIRRICRTTEARNLVEKQPVHDGVIPSLTGVHGVYFDP